jgi:hypothetical protein
LRVEDVGVGFLVFWREEKDESIEGWVSFALLILSVKMRQK